MTDEMDRAVEEQDHSRNMNQSAAMAPDYSDRREYLKEVIEPELSDASVAVLRNMTKKEFILSNLKDAEINEIKKLREITLKKVHAMHPHPSAIMQSGVRKQVYDAGKNFESLSQDEKAIVDTFVRGAFADLARSRGGFQQEQFSKTITASERRTDENEEGGFLDFS